jgi:hypothetical protein
MCDAVSLREDKGRIKFYPCDHTLRDGLHYSQSSCQVTGRWVLSDVDGSERTFKACAWCDDERFDEMKAF